MKKFFKFGCGGLIALIVLLMIIGALLGDDEDNKTNDVDDKKPVSAEVKKEKEPAVEEKKVAIGEELTVGKVTFKANSIEETSLITAGNGMFKYEPSAEGAVYFVVNATIRNDGTEAISTDSSFFKLIADSGAEYSPSTIITADEKFFMYDGINPGLAKTGNVLFEVPAGLTGLDLQVQTGFWGTETGIINLN